MSAQLELAENPAPVPSAWDWARATYPGKKIVRIIDVRGCRQAFAVVDEEKGFLVDGSTHFVHVIPGLTPAEHAAIVAEYDAAWYTDPHREQRA